jgi:coenzyme Q-binding protein COQ10
VPIFSIHKNLPYTAEQLFKLVADIKAYPQFVPGILKTSIDATDHNVLQAHVEFGNSLYKDQYLCQVTLLPVNKITIQGLHGPFTYMNSEWEFNSTRYSAQITTLKFTVDFEFRNKLIQSFAEPIFTKLTYSMVEAFEKRAQMVLL